MSTGIDFPLSFFFLLLLFILLSPLPRGAGETQSVAGERSEMNPPGTTRSLYDVDVCFNLAAPFSQRVLGGRVYYLLLQTLMCVCVCTQDVCKCCVCVYLNVCPSVPTLDPPQAA